jgi:NADH-quinone oxidoreductase subunit H
MTALIARLPLFKRLHLMGPAFFPTGIRQVIPRSTSRVLIIGALVFFVANNVFNAVLTYLVLDGRFEDKWYDFRDPGFAMAKFKLWLDDRNADLPSGFDFLGEHFLSYSISAFLGAFFILNFIGLVLLILVWLERRLLARIQVRRGPNRVGPYGLLQPLADAIKLIQKETIIPVGADRFLYFLPPVLIFIPLLLVWGPMPWSPTMTYLDLNVGILFILAVSSLTTLAIFMAGWSSNNHYALLGAMRTIAMMISYAIPQSIALLAVVVWVGSMNLGEVVAWQADHNLWLAPLLPLALFGFFFSATAELNRTPNDIAEAESEIVAGFHTEYSGMKFGLYLAVELGNALAIGGLVATFFLGGWSLFGLEKDWLPPYMIFGVKTLLMYFVFIWLRGTLPRFRLDQLMGFAWKYLIPLMMLNVLIIAIEASIFARWDVNEAISLTLFTVSNLAIAGALLRSWSRALGYRPELEPMLRPTLTTTVGGLKAAERIRAASARAGL